MLITWGRGHVAENDTAGSVRSDDEDGDEDDDDDNDNSNDNNDDDEKDNEMNKKDKIEARTAIFDMHKVEIKWNF